MIIGILFFFPIFDFFLIFFQFFIQNLARWSSGHWMKVASETQTGRVLSQVPSFWQRTSFTGPPRSKEYPSLHKIWHLFPGIMPPAWQWIGAFIESHQCQLSFIFHINYLVPNAPLVAHLPLRTLIARVLEEIEINDENSKVGATILHSYTRFPILNNNPK